EAERIQRETEIAQRETAAETDSAVSAEDPESSGVIISRALADDLEALREAVEQAERTALREREDAERAEAKLSRKLEKAKRRNDQLERRLDNLVAAADEARAATEKLAALHSALSDDERSD
ncbi:MAG TPA: hypothetical protein VKA89_03930, partial [Solirubrobacterales bacterium]|nr:hypothetical protein [Solirubrobacterales bacterium]